MTPAFFLALAVCAYLGAGLVQASREAAICRADNRITGDRAPLLPVWLVVTLLWPMLVAQRYVLWLLVLHDAVAARRADKREARASKLLAADPGARAGAAAPSRRSCGGQAP